MGDKKYYNPSKGGRGHTGSGGFVDADGAIVQDYKTVDVVNGVKVLKHLTGEDKLPLYSNSPNTQYFKMNSEGRIQQFRKYKGRQPHIDFEWGHTHGKYKIHYHLWKTKKGQTPIRGKPKELTKRMYNFYKKYLNGVAPTPNFT